MWQVKRWNKKVEKCREEVAEEREVEMKGMKVAMVDLLLYIACDDFFSSFH